MCGLLLVHGGADPAAQRLLETVPDLPGRRVLVSGSPAFIGRIRSEIRAAGGTRTRTDAFIGY